MLTPVTAQPGDTLPFDLAKFELKRHVPAGMRFHPARDHLAGNEEYGTFVDDLCAAEAFSIPFGRHHSTLLLINGACTKWVMIATDTLVIDVADIESRVPSGRQRLLSASVQ